MGLSEQRLLSPLLDHLMAGNIWPTVDCFVDVLELADLVGSLEVSTRDLDT